jgi:predicted ATP-grasp superfamily ATP-dependent carboligase
VSYASSAEDLHRKVCGWPEGAYPLILQEKITGPGIGVFLCVHRGATVALFSHRRLREKPPTGGVSVLSESIETRSDLRQYSERLLRELGWSGVAMVEFKLDARDGVPKLMEINGRFWGSLQLAVDAGVDFPAILVATVTGDHPKSLPQYQVGIQSRWFWGDVDSLLITLFGSTQAAGSPTTARKLRSAASFLKLWGKGLRYDNPKLSDPGPWYHESLRWFRDLLAARPEPTAPAKLDDRSHDA